MADIAINPVDRRVQFTGNTGLGPFAFTFNILADADIVAYKNTTLLTLTTDYTITTNVNGTGSITLTGSGNGTALVSSDVLTIIGGRELSRTTDFVTAGDLLASSLNEQLDSQVIMAQQLDEKMTRALKVNPGDEFNSLELPLKSSRLNNYLAFDSNGDPIATAGTSDATPINAALNTFVQSASVAAARAELLTGSNLTIPNDAFSDSTIQSTGDIQLTPDATGKVFITTDNAEFFQAGNVKIADNTIYVANAQGELRLEPNGAAPLLINGTAAVTEDSSTGTILSVHGSSLQGMMELVGHTSANTSSNVGKIQFNMANNDASHKACAKVAVITAGSTNGQRGGNILFKTRDNASSTMSERMRVTMEGKISVGSFSITGSDRGFVLDPTSSSGVYRIRSSATVATDISHNQFYNTNGLVGSINTNANATSFNTSSDHRLKENVVDMSGGIDRVKQLAPKRFNFISDADTTVDGFLAHEAQAVVPEAVTGTHNEVDDDGNPVMQGIDQSKLVPLLTGALQEAIAKIEALEARVTTLENA